MTKIEYENELFKALSFVVGMSAPCFRGFFFFCLVLRRSQQVSAKLKRVSNSARPKSTYQLSEHQTAADAG